MTKKQIKERDHMCVGKLKHPHLLSAYTHVKHLKGRGGDKHPHLPITWYVCEYCEHLHVGHRRRTPNILIIPSTK